MPMIFGVRELGGIYNPSCTAKKRLGGESLIDSDFRQWDAAYEDICPMCTSNGDLYLFSSTHWNRAQAQAVAEWLAVGQQENQ
jgi:hypothetical protein